MPIPKPIIKRETMNIAILTEAVIIVAPTIDIMHPICIARVRPNLSQRYMFPTQPKAPPAAYTPAPMSDGELMDSHSPLIAPRILLVWELPATKPK